MKRLLRGLLRLAALLLITLLLLEIVLQAGFALLPINLAQRTPQYQERYGYLQAAPGEPRQNRPGGRVVVPVTATYGDLFTLTCLSPTFAPPITPYTVAFTRDEHGFRNAGYPAPAALVVVGDSFTAAEGVTDPFWSDLTPATISLGLSGSGSLEQAALLARYGLPYRPAVVVMAYFSGNDLTDTARFAAAQRDGRLLHEARYSPLDYLLTVHLGLYLRDTLRRLPERDACRMPVYGPDLQPVADYPDFLKLATIDPAVLRDSALFTLTRAAILSAAAQAQAAGARFVLLYIPTHAEMQWDRLDEAARAGLTAGLVPLTVDGTALRPADTTLSAAAAITRWRSNQRDLLRELATTAGFTFVDVTPALAAAPEAVYFYGDTHWNQAGHDIAREVLRRALAGD